MPRLRAIVALTTGGIFVFAGLTMLSIRSVSGDSVAEAFYQAFGIFTFGLAGLSLLVGFTPLTQHQEREHSQEFKRCVECQELIWRTATLARIAPQT